MFQNSYSKSPLVGMAANELFPNIHGDAYNGDVSLEATMRALLYDRLPSTADASALIRNVDYAAIAERVVDDPSFMTDLIGSDYKSETEDRLYIITVNCGTNDKETIEKAYNAYKDVNTIDGMQKESLVETNVFGKKDSNGNMVMHARVYADMEHGRNLIMVFDRLTCGRLHLIASLTSRYFKRHFAEKPITQWEKENIASALSTEKTADKYTAAITEFAERFDFRTPMINAALTGFENRDFGRRISGIDSRIEAKRQELDRWNNGYAKIVRDKRALEDQKKVLLLSEPEGDGNGLRDYFLGNRNLHLESVDGTRVRFWAKTTLGNFDREMMEQLTASPRREKSELYQRGSSASLKDHDLLFKALFVDEVAKLWLCGVFTMEDGDNPYFEAESGFSIPPEMHDTMPNPHLYQHHCMGDNQRYANEALETGNYVLAVEQAIGSVASVNLNEGATAYRFIDELFKGNYGKCFELRDGTRLTFSELMDHLREEAA